MLNQNIAQKICISEMFFTKNKQRATKIVANRFLINPLGNVCYLVLCHSFEK